MADRSKYILVAGTLLIAVSNLSGNLSPALAAKSKIVRVRVQQTTKVEYTISYRFDKEKTEQDPDVVHEFGTTTFIAEKAELMDTYIDPRTKRREYIGTQANGLRTDRTTGSVAASGSLYVDDKDSIASSSYNVSSKSLTMNVYIPTLVGDATREVHLKFGATMAGQHGISFQFKDPEAAAAVAGLPKSQSVVTQELLGVSQGDPDFEKFTFAGLTELFGKPSPTAQPIAFQLSQSHPELLWLGLEPQERAGHYLQVRYDKTLTRFPGLVEHLTVSIDFGSPTFKPYKG
jgi:hypothetical protein